MNKCIIPVCGGSAEMQGKAFFDYSGKAAQIYDHVHIILCDSLDVYNMADKSSPLWDQAMETSTAMGDRWLRKHLPHIEKSFKSCDVTRWDEIKADADFEKRQALTNILYKMDENLKNYVDTVCAYYVDIAVERQRQRGHTANRTSLMKRSVAYMLEEIPGTATYCEWFSGAPAVYPGTYFDAPDMFGRKELIMPHHISIKNLDDRLHKAA